MYYGKTGLAESTFSRCKSPIGKDFLNFLLSKLSCLYDVQTKKVTQGNAVLY